MIQVQTELQVADNTGAKNRMYQGLGGSKRRYASIGDTVVIAKKPYLKAKLKRAQFTRL